MHYLILGTPIPGMDVEGHNAWMAEQVAADSRSEANLLVTPDMSPAYVAAQVVKYNFSA